MMYYYTPVNNFDYDPKWRLKKFLILIRVRIENYENYNYYANYMSEKFSMITAFTRLKNKLEKFYEKNNKSKYFDAEMHCVCEYLFDLLENKIFYWKNLK